MSERCAFRLVEGPVDGAWALAAVRGTDAGCTLLFLGTARASSGERAVLRLEYEAYAEMVEPEVRCIAQDALARHAVLRIAVEHSSGSVPVGAGSVAVAIAAAHRSEVFAAGAFVMNELKTRAPIWKREIFADGSCDRVPGS
jgi:molybdopterin synthase catalytic subunit